MSSELGIVTTTQRELFVVRFNGSSPAISQALLDRLEAAKDPRPRVMLVLVPDELAPPDAASRASLESLVCRYFEHVGLLRVVHLGTGLRVAIKRGVSTALILIAGRRGFTVRADRTIEDAAAALVEVSGCPADELLERLVARGLLRADELAR